MQSLINKELGYKGIDYLAQRNTPKSTLDAILSHDTQPELRQCHIMDFNGNIAAHSGKHCREWYGYKSADNISIAGNLLTGSDVIEQMYKAYFQSPQKNLPERVLAALKAGEDAGGDKRGKLAAALYIIGQMPSQHFKFCADDHIDPIGEVTRLYEASKKTV